LITIPGTTGKVKGTAGAEGKFECEVLVSNNELALFQRELAAEVEARGRIEFSREDWTLGATPSEPLKGVSNIFAVKSIARYRFSSIVPERGGIMNIFRLNDCKESRLQECAGNNCQSS